MAELDYEIEVEAVQTQIDNLKPKVKKAKIIYWVGNGLDIASAIPVFYAIFVGRIIVCLAIAVIMIIAGKIISFVSHYKKLTREMNALLERKEKAQLYLAAAQEQAQTQGSAPSGDTPTDGTAHTGQGNVDFFGTPLSGAPVPEEKQPAAVLKKRKLFDYLPSIIAACFGVCAVVFIALPVTPLGTSPYQYVIACFRHGFSNTSHIYRSVFTLVFYMCLFFLSIFDPIYAAVMRKISIRKRADEADRGTLAAYVIGTVIAVYCLYQCGTNKLAAGMFPVLTLIFSVFALAGAITVLILRTKFEKKYFNFKK